MIEDRPTAYAVVLHQTLNSKSEYRATCQTGYELIGNVRWFVCNKHQCSPHEPRCEPVIDDNSPTSSTGIHVYYKCNLDCIGPYLQRQ